MNYLLLIFRSRNEALAMLEYLRSRGVSCTTVNAPRSLMKSCGVALRTTVSQSTLADLLSGYSGSSNVKVYLATSGFGGTNYRQIY